MDWRERYYWIKWGVLGIILGVLIEPVILLMTSGLLFLTKSEYQNEHGYLQGPILTFLFKIVFTIPLTLIDYLNSIFPVTKELDLFYYFILIPLPIFLVYNFAIGASVSWFVKKIKR